jgi:hypothetical protein
MHPPRAMAHSESQLAMYITAPAYTPCSCIFFIYQVAFLCLQFFRHLCALRRTRSIICGVCPDDAVPADGRVCVHAVELALHSPSSLTLRPEVPRCPHPFSLAGAEATMPQVWFGH